MYVGSTSAPNRRIYDHLRRSSNLELREDFITYGLPSFEFTILEFVEFPLTTPKAEVRECLWEKEQLYVNLLLVERGKLKPCSYNVCLSVRGEGRVFTLEARRAMSEGGKGKILSEDHKRKISENHISKQPGYVNHFKGKEFTDAHKQAISCGLLNQKVRVAQYDSAGMLVSVFISLREAAQINKYPDASNISRCINSTDRTYKDCYWRRIKKGGVVPDKIEIVAPPKIIMYDSSMNVLGVYKNSFAIENEAGVHHTVVNRHLNNQSQTRTGYYFEYEKQHNNNQKQAV